MPTGITQTCVFLLTSIGAHGKCHDLCPFLHIYKSVMFIRFVVNCPLVSKSPVFTMRLTCVHPSFFLSKSLKHEISHCALSCHHLLLSSSHWSSLSYLFISDELNTNNNFSFSTLLKHKYLGI